MIGYVFDEAWGNANRDAVARFIAITREAKQILATSDAEWETIAPLTGSARRGNAEGLSRSISGRNSRAVPIADEEADARILYRVLAAIGGRELVGPGQELDPGTFYRAIPGD